MENEIDRGMMDQTAVQNTNSSLLPCFRAESLNFVNFGSWAPRSCYYMNRETTRTRFDFTLILNCWSSIRRSKKKGEREAQSASEGKGEIKRTKAMVPIRVCPADLTVGQKAWKSHSPSRLQPLSTKESSSAWEWDCNSMQLGRFSGFAILYTVN